MDDIIINKLTNGLFDVHQGDKYTEDLTYEEMIGVVVQITIPEEKHCINWLKTKEQHELLRQSMSPTNKSIEDQYGK